MKGYFDINGTERSKASDMECESNIFAHAIGNTLYVFVYVSDDDDDGNDHFLAKGMYSKSKPLGLQASSFWKDKPEKFKKVSWAQKNTPWTHDGIYVNCITGASTKYDYEVPDYSKRPVSDIYRKNLESHLKAVNNRAVYADFINAAGF